MTYIKNDVGVYVLEYGVTPPDHLYTTNDGEERKYWDDRQNPIKDSSDSIGELIEEYVFDKCPICINDDWTWRYITNPLNTELTLEEPMEVYGGIWTKRGLSYVAKLNLETKEWELLK